MSALPADQPPDVPRLPHRRPPATQSSGPARRELPRYRVLLHPDPINDLMAVVRLVMEVTRFPRAEATHKMWEAHHKGRSVLMTTYRERAEFYAELFTDKGLNVSLEPV
jgi:ATP-dependent Clp protease adaptor protein ClpS